VPNVEIKWLCEPGRCLGRHVRRLLNRTIIASTQDQLEIISCSTYHVGVNDYISTTCAFLRLFLFYFLRPAGGGGGKDISSNSQSFEFNDGRVTRPVSFTGEDSSEFGRCASSTLNDCIDLDNKLRKQPVRKALIISKTSSLTGSRVDARCSTACMFP